MKNTIFFGNGINRLSQNAVSWEALLDEIKTSDNFNNGSLPYTLIYERALLGCKDNKRKEIEIKNLIAEKMQTQESNLIFEELAQMDIQHYLTTNYDYAFEKAIAYEPVRLSTEEIYSLRRKRKYETNIGDKYLWNIHGEIDSPKSIMLGLDHYCGSVSKVGMYVKGNYKYTVESETKSVLSIKQKLENNTYCYTSWIDLFFSSHIHIIGLGLDYSETDIWWLLNRRARLTAEGLVKNKVFFYTDSISEEKKDLLESFNVIVKETKLYKNNYQSMYMNILEEISRQL